MRDDYCTKTECSAAKESSSIITDYTVCACKDGYYMSTGSCKTCNSSCATCDSGTACKTCVPGTYKDTTTGLCVACTSGCLSCLSDTKCYLCDAESVLVWTTEASSCSNACSQGQIKTAITDAEHAAYQIIADAEYGVGVITEFNIERCAECFSGCTECPTGWAIKGGKCYESCDPITEKKVVVVDTDWFKCVASENTFLKIEIIDQDNAEAATTAGDSDNISYELLTNLLLFASWTNFQEATYVWTTTSSDQSAILNGITELTTMSLVIPAANIWEFRGATVSFTITGLVGDKEHSSSIEITFNKQ